MLHYLAAAAMLVVSASDAFGQDRPKAPDTVRVRCVDADERPVADAEVYVFESTSLRDGSYDVTAHGPLRSDADGMCAPVPIRDPHRHRPHVYARVPGKAVGAWSPLAAENYASDGLRVQLRPSRSLRGSVHVPEGVNAEGVRVRVLLLWDRGPDVRPNYYPRGANAAMRDVLPERFDAVVRADGSFQLDDLPLHPSIELEVVGPGLAQVQREVKTEGGVLAEPVDISMVAESVFAGVVTASDDKPAAGAVVALQIERLAAGHLLEPSTFRATSGPDGRFFVGGLPAGEFTVTVTTSAGCRYPERIELASEQRRTAEALRLEDGVEVAGIVCDSDAWAPVANALVLILSSDGPYRLRTPLVRTRTDSNGRFNARVPKGPAWLSVQHREIKPIKLDFARPADELRHLEIVVQRR